MEGERGSVFAECARLAEGGERAAYALVVRVRGSGPQVAGARLVLRADGRFTGTVGGGAVEAAVLADAALLRDGDGPAQVRAYQLSADLGMCCGGTMELFLERVSAADAAFWRSLADAEHGDGGVLALVTTGSPLLPAGARLWLRGEPVHAAGLGDAPAALATLTDLLRATLAARPERREPALEEAVDPAGAPLYIYVEPLEAARRLVLFGGGHVAKPLAQLAALLGYAVVVVDERAEWASPVRFPGAALVHQAFVDFLFDFEPRSSDTLLIVTRGHDFDQEVLAALIDQPSRYLGMIGSRAKVKRAFLRLRAAGVSEALIDRVHAPMGLDLGAQTPEEIAVAVAAELVQERRARPRPPSVPGWWRTPP